MNLRGTFRVKGDVIDVYQRMLITELGVQFFGDGKKSKVLMSFQET